MLTDCVSCGRFGAAHAVAERMRSLGKHNPLLKELRKLRDPQRRRQTGRFLIEGRRTLTEALRADFSVETLVVAEGQQNSALVLEFGARGTEVLVVDAQTLERLAPAQTSQGLLGVAAIPRADFQAALRGERVLLLDQVSDPGNVGTLIRSAWAAGGSAVLLHKGTDLWGPKVVRASAGGLFNLPGLPIELERLDEFREAGFGLVAAVAGGGEDLYQVRLPALMLLLLGSEAHGPCSELLSLADQRVTVRLEPGCDSLNVAVSGALVLFEHRRQRRSKGS